MRVLNFASRSSPRGRLAGRSIFRVVLALVVCGAPACQRSPTWNEAFEPSTGWSYGDGAMTAELPGGRTAWLFGDTWVRDNPTLLYNSVAVQAGAKGRAPRKDEIRFYARDGQGRLVDLGEAGGTAKQSWVAPSARGAGEVERSWLWPGGALVSGGKLISIYPEIECTRGDYPACRGYMGNMGFAGHSLVEVANPEDDPEAWRVTTTPLVDRAGAPPAAHRLHWGSTLVEDRGWLYVFGATLTAEQTPGDVVLARVVPHRIADYRAWQFLSRKGWRMFPGGPHHDDLERVASGAAIEYSVDRVERDGHTRLVMVQADVLAREIVVRISTESELASARWDASSTGPGVHRIPVRDLDPPAAGGLVWAGRAHVELSSMPDELLVSYFSEKIHKLRFFHVKLSGLRPWCTAAECAGFAAE